MKYALLLTLAMLGRLATADNFLSIKGAKSDRLIVLDVQANYSGAMLVPGSDRYKEVHGLVSSYGHFYSAVLFFPSVMNLDAPGVIGKVTGVTLTVAQLDSSNYNVRTFKIQLALHDKESNEKFSQIDAFCADKTYKYLYTATGKESNLQHRVTCQEVGSTGARDFDVDMSLANLSHWHSEKQLLLNLELDRALEP